MLYATDADDAGLSREAQKSSLDEKPNFQFGRIPTNTKVKFRPVLFATATATILCEI